MMIAGNRSKPVVYVKGTNDDPLLPDAVLERLQKICPTTTLFATIPPVGPPTIQTEETQQPTVDETPETLYRKDLENAVDNHLSSV